MTIISVISAIIAILLQPLVFHPSFPAATRRYLLFLHEKRWSRCTSESAGSVLSPTTGIVDFYSSYHPGGPSWFNYAHGQCGAEVLPNLSMPHKRLGVAAIVTEAAAMHDKKDPQFLGNDFGADLDDGGASYCWQFTGTQGQLGVALTAIVNISMVSIDYPSDAPPEYAPRNIVLWGVADGEDFEQQYRESPQLRHQLHAHLPSSIALPFPDSYTYIPLARLEYNVHSSQTRQFFALFKEAKLIPFSFGIVIVQVSGNWGGEYTHLCHVGIYGSALKFEE